MPPRTSLALVALLALTGCLSVGQSTPAAPGDSIPAEGERINATVTHVVDGDTVEVRYADGEIDTVRLVGIDTPEAHGDTTPAEFEGVPETAAGEACLADAAEEATDATERLAGGEPVVLAVDPNTDRRDRYDRLLAYVVADGVNVNERLVKQGHARVYDSPFVLADRFYEHERAAQDERRGLWRCVNAGETETGLAVHAVPRASD